MAAQKLKIEGMEDLIKQITDISNDKLKRRELLKILRRQAKPLLAVIKSKVPVSDGFIQVRGKSVKRKNKKNQTGEVEAMNLQKSFKVQTGRSKMYPNVAVGPTRGKKKKNDGWYAHMVLYGTKYIQGDDFVKKAADQVLPALSVTASEQLQKYIVKKTKQIPFIK